MRTLMISAHPEWVEKILNGKKTIEVRPWIPKGELPLKVLIYVTKEKPYLTWEKDINHFGLECKSFELHQEKGEYPYLNEKVVAKFILNKAEEIASPLSSTLIVDWTNEKISLPKTKTMNVIEFAQKTCLLVSDLPKYIKGKVGYAWHIDDLKIFERPKELSEFKNYKKFVSYDYTYTKKYVDWELRPLTKAPQKMVWVYIDEQPKLREPKVLDEETPSEKNESERKPF